MCPTSDSPAPPPQEKDRTNGPSAPAADTTRARQTADRAGELPEEESAEALEAVADWPYWV